MAFRHIVFDIGNVLLDFDPEYAYLDLIPDQKERKAFLSDVCSLMMLLQMLRHHAMLAGTPCNSLLQTD